MVEFVLIGLNHRTAKLDIRQRLSIDTQQLPAAIQQLASGPGIREAMIFSTCNRVELLSLAENDSECISLLKDFLSQNSQIPLSQLQPLLYQYTGEDAVRHVFRVSSSLDSMILGEPQILGQVKSFYNAAVDAGTTGTYLNSLLQSAFHTAKRVRSETSIGEYPVSVSSAAVELARKIFGSLQHKSILIVGAGKMGESAARHLTDSGAKSIYVMNRSPEAAQKIAGRFQGIAVPFEELHQWISRSDIIITSTGASDMFVDCPLIQTIMHERKNAPLVFIDISVPRNVDPKIGDLDNVFCYDIDDLGAVVEANSQDRHRETAAAEKIVNQEVQSFCSKLKSLDLTPVVVQIQNRIEEICRTELERYIKKTGCKNSGEVQELESMVSRIANKVAHPLLTLVRNPHQDPLHQTAYLDMIRRIFKLQKDTD